MLLLECCECRSGILTDKTDPRSCSLYFNVASKRPLQLLRGVADNNGYEAWRILYRDMQPPTRQRSLALVQSLNCLKLEAGKTIAEQATV